MRNLPLGPLKREDWGTTQPNTPKTNKISRKPWFAMRGWFTASKSLLSLIFEIKRAHLVPSK